MKPQVVVLDYGSGNVRSAVRMLERVGASVRLSRRPQEVTGADGLFVPGVGNFHACVRGLREVDAPALLRQRIAAGAPVLGVCVGMQVLFEGSTEPSTAGTLPGIGWWGGHVSRLDAPVVPHIGWAQIEPEKSSPLFGAVADQRFYFVHSYAAAHPPVRAGAQPIITWAQHGSAFVAAVEDGPVTATQFHPEKSGAAGAAVLAAWLKTL